MSRNVHDLGVPADALECASLGTYSQANLKLHKRSSFSRTVPGLKYSHMLSSSRCHEVHRTSCVKLSFILCLSRVVR